MPWELKEHLDRKRDGFVLLDVRTLQEFEAGHLEGARHLHVDELREHLDELAKGQEIFVYCQTGIRSYRACRILMNMGFAEVKNVTGGLSCWKYGDLQRAS